MNATETKAYHYLIEHGYTNIVFHHSTCPDFTTTNGNNAWEVKRIIKPNRIIFYHGQLDQLSEFPMALVMVYSEKGDLLTQILARDIPRHNGTFNCFRIVVNEPSAFKQINITKEVYEKLKSLQHPGQSMAGVITELLNTTELQSDGTPSKEAVMRGDAEQPQT